MTPKMKYKLGDVVTHIGHADTVGLVVELMEAWQAPDDVHFKRHLSGNQYQIYWTICPPGDVDLDECWYPEEHINKLNGNFTQ